MKGLRLEFLKLRRKRVPLVVLVMVAATLAWLFMDAHQEGVGSETGWRSMLFAAPIMNSIFLSLLASIVASRVADVDHEADAWKLLLCHQKTQTLLASKLMCATLIMAGAVALEIAGILAIGISMGFPGMPDASTWGSLLFSQLASCLCIVAIVGAVALRWESQFVAISCGMALSLAGLFSNFLPIALQHLVPSGYFALLSPQRIDWMSGSLTPVFYEIAIPWGDYALLAVIVVAACAFAFVSFDGRES